MTSKDSVLHDNFPLREIIWKLFSQSLYLELDMNFEKFGIWFLCFKLELMSETFKMAGGNEM